jgi:hypothetical protein
LITLVLAIDKTRGGEINMYIDQLVGTWKLVPSEFKYNYSDGQVVYPFGTDAIGLLMYTSNNYMSAQLMRPDRPSLASGNVNKGTPEEIKAAFQGYIAYFGTYEVNVEQGIVIHHVEGSYFPNWVGQDLTRLFHLAGNRLTLTTAPIQSGNRQMTARLIWERIL